MKQDYVTEQMRQQLWETYFETRDIEIRNQLALDYMSVVKYFVYHLRSTYENYAEAEDMMNEGCLALLDAVEKYDPTHNAKFESYASIRVKGAIIDYVRKQDWVPKRSKQEAKRVGDATEALAEQLGRMPTNEELSEYLQLSVKEIEKIQGEIHLFTVLSYEDLVDSGIYGLKGYREQINTMDNGPANALEQDELREMLAQHLESLSEKEQLILTLYYYEELKVKEIAYIMELSSARVCQIHTSALEKMKRKMRHYLSEGV